MRIITTVILQAFICLQAYDVTQAEPTYCVYKKAPYNLNTTVTGSNDPLAKWLHNEFITKLPRGTFLDNGYERCDDSKGKSYCYTLWAYSNGASSAKASKETVIRQGCFLDQSGSQTCSQGGCDTQTPTNIEKLNFCCCHGNKCNEIDTAGGRSRNNDINNVERPPRKEILAIDKRPGKPKKPSTRCAYKSPNQDETSGKMGSSDNHGLGKLQPDGKTAVCLQDHFCFSYYTVDPNNRSQITAEYQGCWEDRDGRNSCNMSVCIPREETHHSNKLQNNSHFCCCMGDMCNNNISRSFIPYVQPPTTPSGPRSRHLHDPSYKIRTIVISLLSVFLLAVFILGFYLVYRFRFHARHIPVNNNSIHIPPSPAFDIDDIKISCLISKGRYSEVWKGSLNEQDVAVKIYTPPYKQYYYNEKYIYSLPHMEHDNLLKFFGGEERILQDGGVQYLLALQYIPDGTLMNYLKNNNLDWYTMCKMCQTLAKGLSHLHMDIGSGDNFKPTVAHRDINSRNVLVKPDLSCVIADLGFCLTAMGSKLIHKGHTENAEQTSLTDVGTLRYMAPELLDGAVNLRDCEASLKQIDIYAYGLVMWEIASRCSDLYQGCPMPEYALPFQAEAGPHPTFEEMQLLVSRNKTRPKFPEVWKDYNQAIRALKETVEECWDQDAEARLTALCVEERIQEMKMLWSHDNRNKGVTPTINTALLSHVSHSNRIGYHGNGHTQWGGLSSTTESSSPNVVAEGSTSALIINDIRDSMSHSESTSTLPPTWTERHGSFSTSTQETTLAQTPNQPTHPKSQNTNILKNHQIPPHQGRNPIVERNTHKRSDEELAVVGNNLMYGKDQNEGDGIQNSDNIFDSLTDSLETSLMQNDVLSHHRTPPISFLQNRVHAGSGGGELPPKVVNNPNERPDNIASVGNSVLVHPPSNLEQKPRKGKEIGILGQLALLGRRAFGGKFDSKRTVPDNKNTVQLESGVVETVGQNNPMFEPSQSVETEVRMTNTGTVVRPANLRMKQASNSPRDSTSALSNHDRHCDNVAEACRISAAREIHTDPPVFSRHRGAPYSKSTSDLSPQKLGRPLLVDQEDEDEEEDGEEENMKFIRPSTLALNGHNYASRGIRGGSLNSLPSKGVSINQNYPSHTKTLHNSDTRVCEESRRTSAKKEDTATEKEKDLTRDKVKPRVKTPLLENRGRLSLYDDRLMSERHSKVDDCSKLKKSSMSLQQFKSIDENCVNVYTDCTC